MTRHRWTRVHVPGVKPYRDRARIQRQRTRLWRHASTAWCRIRTFTTNPWVVAIAGGLIVAVLTPFLI